MCGIFGVIGSDNAFIDIYKGLKMIQHRGQDTCGIATYDNHFNIKKCDGLVTGAFDNEDVDRSNFTVNLSKGDRNFELNCLLTVKEKEDFNSDKYIYDFDINKCVLEDLKSKKTKDIYINVVNDTIVTDSQY